MLFDWIVDHYQLVASVLALIVSIVMFILKKKPVSDIQSYIFRFAIDAVKSVESAGIKGSTEKLSLAIKFVTGMLHVTFPKINPDIYARVISETIENILSTPQKKEV